MGVGTQCLAPLTACSRAATLAGLADAALLQAVSGWAGAGVGLGSWGLGRVQAAGGGAEQFAHLGQANPDAVLQLAADGSLILITPSGRP